MLGCRLGNVRGDCPKCRRRAGAMANFPRPHLPPHRTALALTLSAQFSGGTGWNEPVRICRPGLLVSHIERLGHT